jgi:hypothetical protein
MTEFSPSLVVSDGGATFLNSQNTKPSASPAKMS